MALICFVISLLSKSVGMTWPVLLLLLDAYPLRRIGPWTSKDRSATVVRCLIEKAPFFLAATASAILAIWAQRDMKAFWSFAEHSFSLRTAQAFYGLVFYVVKTIIPYPLLPLYEQRPEADVFDFVHVACAAIVLFAAAFLVIFKRRFPGLAIAACAYGVLVSPMLGFAQSGPQVTADRYSYLACMPWALLIGAVVPRLRGRRPRLRPSRQILLTAGAATWLFLMIVLTKRQTEVWSDSRTLWTHVVKHDPRSGLARANLAILLNVAGEYPAAILHAERALRRLPGNRTAHIALARAAMELGDADTAERALRRALEIQPEDADPWITLGVVYSYQGKDVEAERCFRKAVELRPGDCDFRFHLGSFLASLGRNEEASAEFAEAIRLRPGFVDALFRNGVMRAYLGDYAGAVDQWDRILSLVSDHRDATVKLCWLLATCPDERFRNGDRALRLAQRLVRAGGDSDPRAVECHAAALSAVGKHDEAAAQAQNLLARWGERLDSESRQRVENALETYQKGQHFVHDPTP